MERIANRAGPNLMHSPKRTAPAPRDAAAISRQEAFEQIFQEYWSSIYGILARMVGDPAEAEDLALEAFYRLYGRTDLLQPGFNPAGWLHRVAINLGLHSIRSFRRRLANELSAGRVDIEHSEAGSPLEILRTREEHDLVRSALASLRPRDAELLLLRYSGATYREIAAALAVSPTSIGPLLFRAERDFARRFRGLAQEEI